MPHAPQLAPSEVVLVHAEPHSVGFAGVGHVHWPPWQVCADGHAVVQLPQCVLSVCRFVHEGLQKLGLVVVGHAHVPFWQLSAVGHAIPQPPQFLGSMAVFTHAAPFWHAIVPPVHWQALAWQISVPGHALPHAPQLVESLDRTAHDPLQFACPALHPLPHAYCPEPPATQTGVAPLHVDPHAPQFELAPRLVVQPVPVLPQSAKPAAHAYPQWPLEHVRPLDETCGS